MSNRHCALLSVNFPGGGGGGGRKLYSRKAPDSYGRSLSLPALAPSSCLPELTQSSYCDRMSSDGPGMFSMSQQKWNGHETRLEEYLVSSTRDH